MIGYSVQEPGLSPCPTVLHLEFAFLRHEVTSPVTEGPSLDQQVQEEGCQGLLGDLAEAQL